MFWRYQPSPALPPVPAHAEYGEGMGSQQGGCLTTGAHANGITKIQARGVGSKKLYSMASRIENTCVYAKRQVEWIYFYTLAANLTIRRSEIHRLWSENGNICEGPASRPQAVGNLTDSSDCLIETGDYVSSTFLHEQSSERR